MSMTAIVLSQARANLGSKDPGVECSFLSTKVRRYRSLTLLSGVCLAASLAVLCSGKPRVQERFYRVRDAIHQHISLSKKGKALKLCL